MTPLSSPTDMLALSGQLVDQVRILNDYLKQQAASQPSLAVGASTELWSSHQPSDIETARSAILGLTKQLNALVAGPHEFLHEYVSSNWEHGALSTLLEFGILEEIPLDRSAPVSQLVLQTGIPEPKLLSILRLVSCDGILDEVSDGVFGHTAISEELVKDQEFKAWVMFQLFEPRIASAYLADSIKTNPCDYQTGQSAFKHAWGSSMYEWHKAHPKKLAQFQKAMAGVGRSLDPGNTLSSDWFTKHKGDESHTLVVDIGGRNTGGLAIEFPALSFQSAQTDEIDALSLPANQSNDAVIVYVLRQTLWNCSDDDAIKLIQSIVAQMEKSPHAVLLVNEMMSPARGTFESHIEKGYRRRDLTVMIMHNAKQRTEKEWKSLFLEACPRLTCQVHVAHTSHSYRGLWELRLQPD